MKRITDNIRYSSDIMKRITNNIRYKSNIMKLITDMYIAAI